MDSKYLKALRFLPRRATDGPAKRPQEGVPDLRPIVQSLREAAWGGGLDARGRLPRCGAARRGGWLGVPGSSHEEDVKRHGRIVQSGTGADQRHRPWFLGLLEQEVELFNESDWKNRLHRGGQVKK